LKNFYIIPLLFLLTVFMFAACATEKNRKIEVKQTESSRVPYNGPRSPVVIGKFVNKSSFQRGIFSDGEDRLGNQAKTLLMSHLTQTNRFSVLDRDNMEETQREAQIRGEDQELKGASFVITGDVTEFGRKEVSDQQLFGVLGRGRKQIAYCQVNLLVVDIRTGEMVYMAAGAGEYELSDREVVGFGTSTGYDSTLNGKVLDLALREAVDRLTEAIDRGIWRPAI